MPNNITNIPAPRVAFIDERTGLMAREWYRYLLNLFVLTGSGTSTQSLEDLQLGPPVVNESLTPDDLTPVQTEQVWPQQVEILSAQYDELVKQIDALAIQPPVLLPGPVVPQTVATLPAANSGTRAFVSDASAPTFGAIVAGGGAVAIPVYSDGTNWRVG